MAEQKYYRSDGKEYNPDYDYIFTDKDGNTFTAGGRNGYVWQAITDGVPISINEKGEWYIEPYLDVTPSKVIAHIPEWFKGTDEYTEWQNNYTGYIQAGINKDTFNKLNDILKSYGSQGASRVALGNRAKSFGITDPGLVNKYSQDYINMYNEGKGAGSANISLYDQQGMSAADIAREFKSMSKEDLSRAVDGLNKTINFRNQPGWTGDVEQQKMVLNALQQLEILNHVDDNYKSYGKDEEEFKGLLEASAWQKVYSGMQAANLQLVNSILAIPGRLLHGALTFGQSWVGQLSDMAEGKKIIRPLRFDADISGLSDYTTDPSAGAWLEGREGFVSIGTAIGTVENFVTTYAVSSMMGGWVNGLAAGMAGSSGAILSNLGTFMTRPIGSMVTDFFLHDIPIDFLNYFTVASGNNWDWGKAWNNPDVEQNLIPIPVVGDLGPKVSAGLMNDIVGDVIVDLSLPVLGALGKSTSMQIDSVTNGAATRFKEYVAVKNLQLQEKLTNIPVVGKGWQKMINHFMGAENAAFIRDARKASIAEGNMDWYKIAQNVLTLKNHGGAEDVARLYNTILKKMGVVDSIQKFQKEAKNYGGVSKTQVTWKQTIGGEIKKFSRTVPDVLPKDVKQGLLDIERLSELKGQEAKDGGIISDPARSKEIATLEQRVSKLPQEIKDFADRFSEANKALEKIGVELGITNADWQKAMEMDPEFEKYMVRQALVPGDDKVGSAEKPAILTKSRKGYYAENYIDPTIALNMKAAALGRAHAWNQQAKTVVAMQIAQGKVIAGKGGVDAAKKMAEVKAKIAEVDTMRKLVDYDGVTGGMMKDTASITLAIHEVNELLHAPEKISLKSIYAAAIPPAINEFIGEFDAGRIKFGDGVRAEAGLSDADAAYMVRNTYSYVTTSPDGKNEMLIAKSDSAVSSVDTTKNIYNAGVAPNGTAYRYTVKDGVITGIKEITDPQALADTINRLGGVYKIDASTVKEIGVENSRAINRTILFYRDNMPNLPYGPVFRARVDSSGAFGWIPTPHPANAGEYGFKLENGHIVCDNYPVYLGLPWYKAGEEQNLLSWYRKGELAKQDPKNTSALEYTPIHEMGHNTMARLTILELNKEIDEGKLKLDPNISSSELGRIANRKFDEIHVRLAKQAFESMGVDVKSMSEAEFGRLWKKTSFDTISEYAGGRHYEHETFSESVSDVWANGDTASKLSLAIVEQMRQESQKYAMAASPKRAMQQNDLAIPAKMFKGDQYNFPESAKTNKQKAEWLAKKRKENPYIKTEGLMSTDQYIKANLWDTFFKKEIESYDPGVKTASPKKLIAKNGEFLDDLANNTAKKLVERVKSASIEGFDEDLAMVALGQNKADCAEALDNFIIGRINRGAQKIAEKMPGGATEANLNQARITLWQDASVKREMNNLLTTLAPDLSVEDVMKKTDALFKSQAEGLSAYEALPVDYKNLTEEYKKLAGQLEKSNAYARGIGKKTDKALKEQGYTGDATQTIHYMEGGEDVYVVVRDPVTASILKRPDDYANNGVKAEAFMYAANSIARMYRLGTTGMNPIAFVRNVLRDPLQATATAGFNPLTISLDPQAFYHSLRQYGLDDATIKAVDQKLRTWASSGTMTSEIRSFGGELPSTVGYKNNAERFEKWYNKTVMDSKIVNILESPLEMWESTFRNQVAQQSFTKAMRRTNGDVDKSLASAMFDASNATTNFSHSIYFMRRFSSSIPYLASAINGTASFWRLFNIDPIGMIGRITAGVMVPVMAITAWNLGSEERRKAYMNLPEWYRDGHIVLVDNNGNLFALPIPDEISQFTGTTRRLVEYTQEANGYALPTILAQGAFGFLPVEVDGFFDENGQLNIQRGVGQMASSVLPQLVSTLYEFAFNEKLYTGQDISDYSTFNKIINTLGNVFGSSFTNIVNDLGFLCGSKEDMVVGKSTAETLARDLFGMGFDNAKQQFMQLVGSPSSVDPDTGKETKATGLFAESEKLQQQLVALDKQIAFATPEEKAELEEKKEKLIEDFGQRVKNLTNNYMNLFSVTGGLEEWQRKKLIQILGMGDAVSSAASGSYQAAGAKQSDLDEYALGRQRYVDLGLPSGPTVESLTKNENGNLQNSIELQAAIDRFYGAPKQATQDYKNALEESGLKDVRNEFYAAISKIYDIAEEQGVAPDYDMIERIQARYLQMVDSILAPLINQYGVSILNNNDFIDAVRRQVNGMIPSDDWRQSRRNAKKFLSTKDYPTATVDVKKWLKERYTSGMRDRGLSSDKEVVDRLGEIKKAIDSGQKGVAKSKIESLRNGIDKANYYISSQDYQKLLEYYNMVK